MTRFATAASLALVALVYATPARAQAVQGAPPASPRAFPAGAPIGFINVERVAALSAQGKSLAERLQSLRDRKAAEVAERAKEVEALESKLTGSGALLNENVREQLRRQFQRAQVDFQRLAQDADAEVRQLQQELQMAFTASLVPAVGRIATEKNLWAVFSETESGLVWKNPALDLSEEVAKRMDEEGRPN